MGRMMGDSIPWSAHPPTSRIPRAVKKEEKKENRERERERHGLIGVALRKEGTLNLAARIAFRSGYENFPPRSPAFLYTVIVFIFNREGHRAASNVGTKAIDLWKWERHVLREEGCGDDRVTIDWTSKNGQHASLRVMLKREVDYHVVRWYVYIRIVYAITKRKIYKYIYTRSIDGSSFFIQFEFHKWYLTRLEWNIQLILSRNCTKNKLNFHTRIYCPIQK